MYIPSMLTKPRQKHDWQALLAEFDASVAKDKHYLLKTFCSNKFLDSSMVAREFSKIRQERALSFLERAKSKLAQAAEPIVDRLINISTNSDDEATASRTGLGLLDRMGLSPQVAQVAITNQIQNNVVVAPLFAEAHRPDMDGMFAGVEPLEEP